MPKISSQSPYQRRLSRKFLGKTANSNTFLSRIQKNLDNVKEATFNYEQTAEMKMRRDKARESRKGRIRHKFDFIKQKKVIKAKNFNS